MKIVFVGAGRLATNLAPALYKAGHEIIQVYSCTLESANKLAILVGAQPIADIEQIVSKADVYIIALKDSVLEEVIPALCAERKNSVFLHTSGSVPISIFENVAINYGVFYPLQTFSKDRTVDFSNIPIFIEASNDGTIDLARRLAGNISNNVNELSSDNRRYIHLSAVFVNNFVNHCYTIAADILTQQGLSFEHLIPLIDETTSKVHDMTPQAAQTGPAIRYDENVINKHLAMLKDTPLLKQLYENMSCSIHQFAQSTKQN